MQDGLLLLPTRGRELYNLLAALLTSTTLLIPYLAGRHLLGGRVGGEYGANPGSNEMDIDLRLIVQHSETWCRCVMLHFTSERAEEVGDVALALLGQRKTYEVLVCFSSD